MTEQQKQYLREYYKRTHNASTKRYEKTVKGFLMRLYRNMQSRVTGVQKLNHHLYKDKDLLDRQTFYNWSNKSRKFKQLYKKWAASNYDRKLTPSVGRVNPTKGYKLSNMEWVTHSENSRRSSITRRRYSPNLQETVRAKQK